MRDVDGVLRRASRTFSPHRVDEVYVNVSTALFIEAEDLRFGALELFRVLDPRGRVVLYYSCEPTSSSDASSPLSVFDGAFIVAMDVSEQGDLVDIEFVFDNGYRIQVFDMDPWETWSLSLEGVVLHGA